MVLKQECWKLNFFLNKLWPSKPNSFTLNLGIRNENWSSPFQTSAWFDHWWRLKYSKITIWRKNVILIITIWTGLSIDWTNQSKDEESHKKFHFHFLKKFRLYTHKITKEKLQLNLIKQSFTLLYGKVLDFWLFCVGNLIIFQSLISFVKSFSDIQWVFQVLISDFDLFVCAIHTIYTI